jgi:hypothetical protein
MPGPFTYRTSAVAGGRTVSSPEANQAPTADSRSLPESIAVIRRSTTPRDCRGIFPRVSKGRWIAHGSAPAGSPTVPPGRTPKVLTLRPAGQVELTDQYQHTPGPHVSRRTLPASSESLEGVQRSSFRISRVRDILNPHSNIPIVQISNPHKDFIPLAQNDTCPAREGSNGSPPKEVPCVPMR